MASATATGSMEAVCQSMLLMAAAFGNIADTLTNAPIMITSTRNVAATLTVPSAVTVIEVMGIVSVGDGDQGLYMRVSADPGVPDSFQSADGAWWLLTGGGGISSLVLTDGLLSVTLQNTGGTFDIFANDGTTSMMKLTQAGDMTVHRDLTVTRDLTVNNDLTVTGALTVDNLSVTDFVDVGNEYRVATVKVIGPQITGWTQAVPPYALGGFDPAFVNVDVLAQNVGGIIDVLMTHGLIAP